MRFKLKKNFKGFTLIEIIVVLALIAILGSITIMSDYKTNKSKNSFSNSLTLLTGTLLKRFLVPK